jgi:ribosomal protein S12 methylthiotransferase
MSSDRQRVHFVSLGCPKNRVDSELMLGQMFTREFDLAERADEADVIVVNTCGFIEDAKKESIATILDMATHRTSGRARGLLVTGCLAQRYADSLIEEIPEIDAVLGNGAYEQVAEVARKLLGDDAKQPTLRDVKPPHFIHSATMPRVNSFQPHSAYVKVSEGCDQKCSFCIIPSLRGKQLSRPIEDIVQEVETLGSRGVVEINLVAQDLTGYGSDLRPKRSLAQLLRALAKVESIRWIRPHYAYPRPFRKDLLDAFSEESKIVPYIDMPLQHISDPVLKRMRRGRPRRFIESLLADIRNAIPDVTLRTSFIVGFPGETDDDFRELCDFVEAQQFAHVGVFRYSREEGTTSYDLDGQVPRALIAERHDLLTEILRETSRAEKATWVGRTIEVLVEGEKEPESGLTTARHRGQAPEVDGHTLLTEAAHAGDLLEAEVIDSSDYDLVARPIRVLYPAPPRPDHPWLDARPRSSQQAEPAMSRSGRLPILA